MCIKHHQCEQVKFHIIDAKSGIEITHYYLMKSWNAIKMGFVWDINPINYIRVLKTKHII
jgi:hypothetical protein